MVTGASGGIGRATAVALAGEGASVLLVGRRSEVLDEVAGLCSEAGGSAEPLVLDVTAVDAGERVLEACLERFGRIDALVNGAGTSEVRPMEELTDEEWQAQWELHVMGPMRLMRAAAPEMARREWGRIVNVCSSSGKRPSATNMAYSVTKAAQLSLSRAFADLYARRGVLVNSVSPAFSHDEFHKYEDGSPVGGTCFATTPPTGPCTVVMTASLAGLGIKSGSVLDSLSGLSLYFLGTEQQPPGLRVPLGNSSQADATAPFDYNGTGTTG